jgi:hypothetical protein
MAKKKFSCAFGVLAILVAGCGEREAESASAEPASASGQSAEPVKHAEPVKDEGSVAVGESQPGDSLLGPALDEPGRYFGVYAAPERPARGWFIAEAKRPAYAERAPEVPPGHLMLGAMFGDVAPWQMKTMSDTQFEQAQMGPGQTEPVAIEFRFDAAGQPTAFRFTGGVPGYDAWLERTGDLPEGW